MESSNVIVLKELKLLNEKFGKLEADVTITRNANTLLSSCLVDTERQRWANAQYPSRGTLENIELPKFLTNNEAETMVCQMFQSLECNVNKEDLDACHFLKDQEEIIVKFSQRKNYEKVLKANIDLRKLNTANLDVAEGSKIFLTNAYALIIVYLGQ